MTLGSLAMLFPAVSVAAITSVAVTLWLGAWTGTIAVVTTSFLTVMLWRRHPE